MPLRRGTTFPIPKAESERRAGRVTPLVAKVLLLTKLPFSHLQTSRSPSSNPLSYLPTWHAHLP
jgi:hypothetical protein